MKILHVIPSISKKRGGPSFAVINMVRELRAQGIDASIITTCDNQTYREYNITGKRDFWIEDVPVLMFPIIETRYRVINEYLVSPELTFWLLTNIEQYDAVHIHSIFSYCCSSAMLVARFKKIPYLVRTIGQLNTWSLSQSKVRKTIMLFLLEYSNLKKSSAIHVTSTYEYNDLLKICKHPKILCLQLGVDIPEVGNQILYSDLDEIRFLFLSRIHPKKQLDIVLQAFSLLFHKYNKRCWKLSIAGDGDKEYLSSLQLYALRHGISNNIEWLGHVGAEKKSELLNCSHWYILPSKSENFGISVVESLAHGTPVIISKEVGVSSMVSEHKAGYVINNRTELEDSLLIALSGSSREMRNAALKLAKEHFSWPEVIRNLILFYNEIVIDRSKV
jgi:glycosyltransferase involved in cell wall biosynthesis